MPPKQTLGTPNQTQRGIPYPNTPTPTQRVLPYDLRRTHIPRVPTPNQPESSSRPAGGYIPRSTTNQIAQMRRKATARNAVQKRVRFRQDTADDEAIPSDDSRLESDPRPKSKDEIEDEIEDRMRRTGDYQISLKTLPDTTRHSFDVTLLEENMLGLIQAQLGEDNAIISYWHVPQSFDTHLAAAAPDVMISMISPCLKQSGFGDCRRTPANFRKGKLMITFEISAVKEAPAKQKRSADDASTVSSSSPAPPEKKRRGDRLQDQHTVA
ncbi:hypothetical protein V1525DRAFT_416354 [Lipomyces kononenkoae]|uniref:Uncharacterized protein n=1 Tax=Lipomyces kononenkoae TaxID=34357 RepID=A0ACC3TA86_LIPKO